jgi:hypothetical protein
MYGKIFDSMYEGTLYGHWEAIVTLQQMLVLCNQDGVIDMTPQAIAARTSIPFEIISKGIDRLIAPDAIARHEYQRAGHVQIDARGRYVIAGYRKLFHGNRLPWSLWAAIRAVVFARDGYECQYCGANGVPLEPDHVHPLSRGGSNDLGNLVTACVPCNRSKSNKTLNEWLLV